MKAMLLEQIGPVDETSAPLRATDWPTPTAGPGEVLVEVSVCGVCHTELDEIEGRTPPPELPVIPGHQAVGTVVALGEGVAPDWLGRRVGIAWIHSACGDCEACRAGLENLCPAFRATGRDHHGGYAQFLTAPAAFVHPIPAGLSDLQAAPLLCAGAIGYRSLKLTGLTNGQTLGLTGFGASAHLVLMMARHCLPDSPVFVFARDPDERRFALELGAIWAGAADATPPAQCHAIIDTTPVWSTVLLALERLRPQGRLVINAIRKLDTDRPVWLTLDYPKHLWLEKEIKTVANVTRRDVREFLALAAEIPLHPAVEVYPLSAANQALIDLKQRRIRGAKVLTIG